MDSSVLKQASVICRHEEEWRTSRVYFCPVRLIYVIAHFDAETRSMALALCNHLTRIISQLVVDERFSIS